MRWRAAAAAARAPPPLETGFPPARRCWQQQPFSCRPLRACCALAWVSRSQRAPASVYLSGQMGKKSKNKAKANRPPAVGGGEKLPRCTRCVCIIRDEAKSATCPGCIRLFCWRCEERYFWHCPFVGHAHCQQHGVRTALTEKQWQSLQ